MKSDHAPMIEKAKNWARALKRDVQALYLAGRDPRTPWFAKAVAIAVAAYAISPIDLIPDFIPIFGYLDDLIIVPLGIMLAIRLIPPHLMLEFRQAAAERDPLAKNGAGAAVIIAIWIAGFIAVAWWAMRRFS